MINCRELAYVTFQVTDLDVMESFLVDFGMARSTRTDDALYMRGMGTAHHIHVSKKGSTDAFLGLAFEATSIADLEAAAQLGGASGIEQLNGPAGGRVVHLATPGGHTVDIVHGLEQVDAQPVRDAFDLNFSGSYQRFNRPLRPACVPAPVLRLGHAVLRSPKASEDIAWFEDHFGLLASDYICMPGDEDHVLGAFLRFNRGSAFVDHHVVLITQSDQVGCHHSSFEVSDIDSVFTGNEYLAERGHNLDAGPGRHLLGSLIFDYWWDPFGNRIEHYTDGDLLNDEHQPTRFTGTAEETTQWGAKLDSSFFE